MKDTAIQWCDSTINLMMGCDGCELWDRARGVRHCYAGALTERWKGRPGWPETFEQPALFLHRLETALCWTDLTGRPRASKPWLDGLPRLVFLNDMGDTFTESLPLDWLDSVLEQLASSPHVWIILTKRPKRAIDWINRQRTVPRNIWFCISLTGLASLGRLSYFYSLRDLLPNNVLGLSIEPLLADLLPELKANHSELFRIVSWVILGGESRQLGTQTRPCRLEWLRRLINYFRGGDAALFVKQLGSDPRTEDKPVNLADGHGGDWSEWPADLRCRDMPQFRR